MTLWLLFLGLKNNSYLKSNADFQEPKPVISLQNNLLQSLIIISTQSNTIPNNIRTTQPNTIPNNIPTLAQPGNDQCPSSFLHCVYTHRSSSRSIPTSTCQTFSLAPSKLQKRMLTPSKPWPPHKLLGVTEVSRSSRVLLL